MFGVLGEPAGLVLTWRENVAGARVRDRVPFDRAGCGDMADVPDDWDAGDVTSVVVEDALNMVDRFGVLHDCWSFPSTAVASETPRRTLAVR